MPLREFLSSTWDHIQGNLFPWLTEELGPLSETHKRLISTLELVRIDAFLGRWPCLPGRPLLDRGALARAFVAKMVIKVPTTSMLIEHLGAEDAPEIKQHSRSLGHVPIRLLSRSTIHLNSVHRDDRTGEVREKFLSSRYIRLYGPT